MNRLKNHIVLGTLLLLLMCSIGCTNELIKTNINPNDADPDRTNPNLVLSTVLTQAGQTYVNLGFGDLMGVMQYTKKMDGGHRTTIINGRIHTVGRVTMAFSATISL